MTVRSCGILAILPVVACAASAGAQAAPSLHLVPELRIDPVSNDLSFINLISVSRDGRIAVMQPQDNRVLVFSAGGKLAGTFGREGEGPGEFRGPYSTGWKADTLWVESSGLRRTTFISPEYHLLRDVPFAPDTAAIVTSPCEVRYQGRSANNPLCARPISAASSDSGWVVRVEQDNPTSATGHFTVTLHTYAGDTAFSKVFTSPAVAIPDALTARILAAIARGSPPEMSATLKSRAPHNFAPIRIAWVGYDGSIWLMESGPWNAPAATYRVLDRNGATVGTVTLPAAVLPGVVSKDRLWAIVTGDDGLQAVVRYRVEH